MARIERSNDDPETDLIQYYQNNLNGCPEEVTNKNGEIIWSAEIDVLGNTTNEFLSLEDRYWDQNLRFQGQYLDRETGLHYNTFRYFDPKIGRFTQLDPIGLNGGFNLYQYAPNVLGWIDPLGWAAGPCAPSSSFDRLKNGKVYRVIRADENPALGFSPKNINANYTIAGHVSSNSKLGYGSQYISATKDIKVAEKWAKQTNNRITEIDLSKTSGALDISSSKGLELIGGSRTARNFAKSSAEVLFDSPVPSDAIKIITPSTP